MNNKGVRVTMAELGKIYAKLPTDRRRKLAEQLTADELSRMAGKSEPKPKRRKRKRKRNKIRCSVHVETFGEFVARVVGSPVGTVNMLTYVVKLLTSLLCGVLRVLLVVITLGAFRYRRSIFK